MRLCVGRLLMGRLESGRRMPERMNRGHERVKNSQTEHVNAIRQFRRVSILLLKKNNQLALLLVEH